MGIYLISAILITEFPKDKFGRLRIHSYSTFKGGAHAEKLQRVFRKLSALNTKSILGWIKLEYRYIFSNE
jgi:hypothetical protein